jgi:thioester reductase-like protein
LTNQFVSRIRDLNAEVILDPAISPETESDDWIREPSSVFLTGATGFLGAFLLYELLRQTQAVIYCLVRSPHEEEGKQRIQGTLESYSLWNEHVGSRIIPVPGDLSRNRLGLSIQQFEKMAREIDVIYHNGASVNFVYPYSVLKATNVLGTQEVLRLACARKVKPVHYVSTVSVFNSTSYFEQNVFYEHEHPISEGLVNGYSQSKWVAEQLVAMAGSRGLPVGIYRPGRITGHSQIGVWNTDDLTCRMLKGCIQMGLAPYQDMLVDMVPVDYVSQAIIHLSKQQESQGKVFHVVNPQPMHWSNLIEWICSVGYPIQQIPYEQWRTQLVTLAVKHSQENAFYLLLPIFLDKTMNFQKITAQRFDCRNTLTGLSGTSIICPPVDTILLRAYFEYFIRSGFLVPPPINLFNST